MPLDVQAHFRSDACPMKTENLNALGLKCPLPVLRARKKLGEIETGDRLVIQTDDPGAGPDFLAYCEASGNRLLSHTTEGDQLTFVIEKS